MVINMLDRFIMCECAVTVINTAYVQTYYIDYNGYEQKYYLWASLPSGEHVKIKEIPEMTDDEQKNFLSNFISSVYERR